MVAVVRAFDLHDVVAAGRGARDADRAHRRLGARVGEANLLEVEAPAELLGEQHGVLGRCREVRCRCARARSIASTIFGCAWPTTIEPKPPWKSTYSLPSTSQTLRAVPVARGRSGTGRRPGTTTPTPSGIDCSTRARTARATPACASSRRPCSSSAISRARAAHVGIRWRGRRCVIKLHHHVLDLGVVLDRVDRHVLAVARLLEAAVRAAPTRSGCGRSPRRCRTARSFAMRMRPADVARPDARRRGRSRRRWPTRAPASSSVNRCTVTTGPNTSRCTISLSWAGFTTTDGS